jgi:hypothetical protein
MRTKTLALSTLLGALGTASSLVAQVNVYSINAVGYINVTLPPGYSVFTCPLIATPDNTLTTLFPATANGYIPGDGPSPYWHAQALTFSGGAFGALQTASYSGGWLPAAGPVTVSPGSAVFFFNPNPLGSGVNLTNTIVGTVPQNGQYNMTNTLAPGYNLVGSIVPVTGSFASPIVNLTNSIGAHDQILNFDPTFNGSSQNGYSVIESGSYSQGWLHGPGAGGAFNSEPVSTNVTQGFFYYNATAQIAGVAGESSIGTVSASNELWVENFTINP